MSLTVTGRCTPQSMQPHWRGRVLGEHLDELGNSIDAHLICQRRRQLALHSATDDPKGSLSVVSGQSLLLSARNSEMRGDIQRSSVERRGRAYSPNHHQMPTS